MSQIWLYCKCVFALDSFANVSVSNCQFECTEQRGAWCLFLLYWKKGLSSLRVICRQNMWTWATQQIYRVCSIHSWSCGGFCYYAGAVNHICSLKVSRLQCDLENVYTAAQKAQHCSQVWYRSSSTDHIHIWRNYSVSVLLLLVKVVAVAVSQHLLG